jgi:SAM-dependent methyltransferase
LSYAIATSGWTDELTRFHEGTAGAHHPIDRASRQHAIEQLEAHLRIPTPVVLEVGCSSGFMLRLLRERCSQAFVIGADFVREPLEKLAAARPDLPLLRFDLTTCPLPERCVDAVVLLNVLEHIQEDEAALRQIHRILKPGGVVIIEVPAGPSLYDVYDKVLLHHRRYALKALCELAKQVGFHVVERSHLGFFVYPAFWFIKKRHKSLLAKEGAAQQQVVAKHIGDTQRSSFLDLLMRLELLLGRWVAYPYGIRCLLTCRKM